MNIKNLSLSFGLETIFDDITICLPEGRKIGVIGVNGVGKTTFFRLLLGQIEPDYGSITFFKKLRISWLPQVITDEILGMDISVFDYLLTGRPIQKLENEITALYEKMSTISNEKEVNQLLRRVEKLQNELDCYDPYHAEEELLKLLSGMKIDDTLLDFPLCKLSGGQKSKIAFLRLLYSKPEILLLDEPTNHLDESSRKFVVQYLKNYSGTVFVISHDSSFLNELVTDILYLDKRTHKMELFSGNFRQFEQIQREQTARLEKKANMQQKEREHLQRIIDKYIHGNEKKARIAKDRKKKLARLEKDSVILKEKQKTISLSLHQGRESTLFPLKIENLCFKYEKSAKRYLLYKINVEIPRGEKFLIVGENGVGKSTLLKLIVGDLTPDLGSVLLGPKTDIGYYAQEHELLNFHKNIIENLQEFNLTEREIREVLGKFLFHDDDLYKKISILSPGERARLALAKLTLKKANLLVLDEPTNHLDPETQKVIATNLRDFPGTIILVSHQPEFVDFLGVERTLILPEGRLSYYQKEMIQIYQELNEKNS